jgi:hypothetical protein
MAAHLVPKGAGDITVAPIKQSAAHKIHEKTRISGSAATKNYLPCGIRGDFA